MWYLKPVFRDLIATYLVNCECLLNCMKGSKQRGVGPRSNQCSPWWPDDASCVSRIKMFLLPPSTEPSTYSRRNHRY